MKYIISIFKVSTLFVVAFILAFTVQSCVEHKQLSQSEMEEFDLNEFENFSPDIFLVFILGRYKLKNYSDVDQICPRNNLNRIIYKEPAIRIQYSFMYDANSDEFITKAFELKADNAEYFTEQELLFKINRATYDDLSNESHNILEGLAFIDRIDNIEYYELLLGS